MCYETRVFDIGEISQRYFCVSTDRGLVTDEETGNRGAVRILRIPSDK